MPPGGDLCISAGTFASFHANPAFVGFTVARPANRKSRLNLSWRSSVIPIFEMPCLAATPWRSAPKGELMRNRVLLHFWLILVVVFWIGCSKRPNDDQIKNDIQSKVASDPETKDSVYSHIKRRQRCNRRTSADRDSPQESGIDRKGGAWSFRIG